MTDAATFAGPDLTKPLVVDQSAFGMADTDLRTDLRVAFGDGVYRFHLTDACVGKIERRVPLGKLTILDKRFNGEASPLGLPIGIGAVYAKLCRGRALFGNGAPIMAGLGAYDPAEATFFRDDIALVIGWGLVGGGEGVVKRKRVAIDEDAAEALLDRYVHEGPLAPNWTLAFAILGTRLFGRAVDPRTGE